MLAEAEKAMLPRRPRAVGVAVHRTVASRRTLLVYLLCYKRLLVEAQPVHLFSKYNN
jgi:hypothetical protein